MKISITPYETYAVLSIEGSLSVEHRSSIEGQVDFCFNEKLHLIIDLSGVTYIDSSTLGMILLYNSRFAKNDLSFVLININKQIYQMFSITGVSKTLPIFDSLENAIAFLGEH
jgi:anti-sigma B factor antagonist